MNTAKILPYETSKTKGFQLLGRGGASPPDLLTRGSAPGPRWGLRPQTLVNRLALRGQGPFTLFIQVYAYGWQQRNNYCLFLRATAGTAIARLSHRNPVRLSVCPSVRLSHRWIRQKTVQARIIKSSQSAAPDSSVRICNAFPKIP